MPTDTQRAPTLPAPWPCEAMSDEGDPCIVPASHDGAHQRRSCDGTCDICECDFVTQAELDMEEDDDDGE